MNRSYELRVENGTVLANDILISTLYLGNNDMTMLKNIIKLLNHQRYLLKLWIKYILFNIIWNYVIKNKTHSLIVFLSIFHLIIKNF